jgi:hypothetical protein
MRVLNSVFFIKILDFKKILMNCGNNFTFSFFGDFRDNGEFSLLLPQTNRGKVIIFRISQMRKVYTFTFLFFIFWVFICGKCTLFSRMIACYVLCFSIQKAWSAEFKWTVDNFKNAPKIFWDCPFRVWSGNKRIKEVKELVTLSL